MDILTSSCLMFFLIICLCAVISKVYNSFFGIVSFFFVLSLLFFIKNVSTPFISEEADTTINIFGNAILYYKNIIFNVIDNFLNRLDLNYSTVDLIMDNLENYMFIASSIVFVITAIISHFFRVRKINHIKELKRIATLN